MDKKILLIADDDAMSRETVKAFLSDMYTVLEAKDGEETINILESQSVDIVILDILMPVYSGFEVLQKVKMDEKYKDIKVLVATSVVEQTERQALELGADDIVFKPYDPVVIKKRVDNMATLQDQKRELEDALIKAENANTAKTDFLSRISHDMRTPLNGILGIAALMKNRATDSQTTHDLLELEMSGQYLLNLINDTLDVNKIEMGRLELHPGVCDGRLALNGVIKLIKPNIDKKNQQLIVHADNLPFTMLYIDLGRVEQVCMNILGNACKFTPDGGTIEISMTNISHDDNVIWDQIVIRDNGIGMSKEFLEHIFEPFSQENAGRTGNTNGTGLGMTITKQIVDLMGGNITVESELGHGTLFTLQLPFKVASPRQVEAWKARKRSTVGDYKFEGKRVLLCEDHPLNAEIATRLLEKKGVKVDHAENGAVGVDMFKQSDDHYYDMIFMDVRMPVMDGLEATRAIRRLDRVDARNVPIVAMTANAFDDDVRQTQEAGMNGHLGKPIEVDKLYQCLSGVMQMEYQPIRRGIVVVDDIDTNRVAIVQALMDDYEIYEAASGAEALDILANHAGIDIVITDIQMPGMDGCALIEKIRANRKYDHISIIANTQFGDPEQEEHILDIGADDFVYKPTTPKIVEIRVKNILGRI